MTDDRTNAVELQIRLGASPEEVFLYLTVPERYVRWQGVKAELDPRPGGVYRVWMDANTVASGDVRRGGSRASCDLHLGVGGQPGSPARLDHSGGHPRS